MLPSILYNFAFDSDRKNLYSIYRDLSYLRKKQFSTKSYFTNLMYKKSSGNIDNYVDEKIYLKISKDYYRPIGKNPFLEEKIVFQEHLKAHNIPGTKLLGKLRSGNLTVETNSYTEPEKVKSKLKELATVHGSIFIKCTDTSGGEGIFKVNNGDAINLDNISMSRDYIVEQTLTQHEALNKINPHSINTLRVITFKVGNHVVIPNCFFRMSIGKSFLDNASAGGVFVSYDITNNKLGKTAYQLFKNGAKSFTRHPVTNFEFKDTPLPFVEEVKDIVTRAANSYEEIESIGWDIAFTKDGPVIVEGNDKPHVVMTQITSHGLLNNNFYRQKFKEYFSGKDSIKA